MNIQGEISRLQCLIDGSSSEALKIIYLEQQTEWIKRLPIPTGLVLFLLKF